MTDEENKYQTEMSSIFFVGRSFNFVNELIVFRNNLKNVLKVFLYLATIFMRLWLGVSVS